MIKITVSEDIWKLWHRTYSTEDILKLPLAKFYEIKVFPDDILHPFKTKAIRILDDKEVALHISYKLTSFGDESTHVFEICEI